MKLKENIDLVQFFHMAGKCDGDIFFKSDEGDLLNLKSTLSQYLFSASCGNKKFISNGVIECEKREDYDVLGDFLG